MATNLVIVESPSKASTIKGYLGSNYKVIASKGHFRDLPESTMGVDVENDFAPRYINKRGYGDIIKEIKKEAKNAGKIYLATDLDREGEAISWHLANILGIPVDKTLRVTFNEITKNAVKASIKEPRHIDMNLVDAQQTRRILDRLVGYKISPILWKTVKPRLAAGRVQSIAVRIIVDREQEIRDFVPAEYWTIDATLATDEGKTFAVHFYGDKKGKIKLSNEGDAQKVLDAIDGKKFSVSSIKRSTRKKTPAPPFITSTLQQEASRRLGFRSSKTMEIAQALYEGINLGSEFGGTQGLITYMRTDSLRISNEAQEAAKEFIISHYGKEYYPSSTRVFKAKGNAQDAHEAIRPARVDLEPQKIKKMLTADQFKLYNIIWKRFVASQMQSATLNTLTVDFDVSGYVFRTSGFTVAFKGYMAVYEELEDESRKNGDDLSEEKNINLPDMTEGQILSPCSIDSEKHFTEPPARFNEASLIKLLEDKGIGRPSTYTTIISTIIKHGYVGRDGKSLVPTNLGEITNGVICQTFKDIVDDTFTANMENELDDIASGNATMLDVLREFWSGFSKELEEATEKMDSIAVHLPAEETDMVCEKCGARMIVKEGRYGKFAACPNYPQCRNTKPLAAKNADDSDIETSETSNAEDRNGEHSAKEAQKQPAVADFKCEKCGGDMVLRSGKYGSFYACANYPKCKFTKQKVKDIGVSCPKCGKKIIVKSGRNKAVFYSCEGYPECDFSTWDMPLDEKCPKCNKMLFRKKAKNLIVCHDKECGYTCEAEDATQNSNE